MKKEIHITLAEPRGFCAGVDRAITIVEKALEKYGSPIYVRHEVVHNEFVIENLKKKGAIFVENMEEMNDREETMEVTEEIHTMRSVKYGLGNDEGTAQGDNNWICLDLIDDIE